MCASTSESFDLLTFVMLLLFIKQIFQVGVDIVTGGLALASLCLLSAICRVPACSDSLAKAADPHALAGYVQCRLRMLALHFSNA